MNRLGLLVGPLGLMFAWSAPWQCSTFSASDGGFVLPNDGGQGGLYQQDASLPVVLPPPDAGGSGLQAGPDGGITIGPSAAFQSNFVYMANAAEDTVSRVIIDDGGVAYEEARYFSIVPINNHFHNEASIWDNFGQLANSDGRSSPSRTLVDRNGNVWVALRAPGIQAGATRIINVDDNAAACVPRCTTARVDSSSMIPTLAAGQPYTEGLQLNLVGGGQVDLLPALPPGILGIPNVSLVSTHALRPNTPEAQHYSCPGHNPNSYDDPVNYDDCVSYSISLGDPQPDPDADPAGRTHGYSFGRAAAIAPNCDAVTRECDVWIGMYNGAGLAHLSFNGTSSANVTPAPFDVQSVIPTPGINPYGISVDCAGIAWTTPPASGNLAAFSTVSITYIPDGGLPDAAVVIPPETLLTQFPSCATGLSTFVPNNSGYCGAYGISSDQEERIWIGGYGGSKPASACSFNGTSLLLAATSLYSTSLCSSTAALLANSWAAYDFGNVATTDYSGNPSLTINGTPGAWKISRGVNVDKGGNVFVGEDTTGSAAVSFNPDGIDGGTMTVACVGGDCRHPAVQLNWALNDPNPIYGGVTVGIDLDADGNPWINNQSGGYAVQLDANDGTLKNHVKVGSGPYSYSDFTGYALRYITLSRAAYNTQLAGCGVSPELTQYNTINYTATVPPGTDLQFDVRVVNDCGNAASIAAATDYTVCDTVERPSTHCPLLSQTIGAGGSQTGVLDLIPFNLPQGKCLEVSVTMTPLICAMSGGSNPLAKPVIYALGGSQTCAGD